MAIFKLSNDKLESIQEKKIDLEKDVQLITEKNLEEIFGLKFVSGALNQEFSVRASEQDFYIDTIAFDEANKSIVLIEYKKDKSFSVIDQGFAYLAAMLNNKAEFVLELNERLKKSFTKKDIDWELSRIIFISNEFTNYQKNAINFKDLPMFLYEVKVYNDLIDYNPIKPYKTSESIKKFVKDKNVQEVTKEIKVYSVDDLISRERSSTRELYGELSEKILALGPKINEIVNKHYIAYKLQKNGQWYNFVEILPQATGLIIHLDTNIKSLVGDSAGTLEDCSGKGILPTGRTRFKLIELLEIDYALSFIKQSYEHIMADDNLSWHKGTMKS